MQQVTSIPINYPFSLTTSLTFPEKKEKEKTLQLLESFLEVH